ncbi:MAG: aldo/keto reductase [Hormoscilla sp.]
MTISGQATAAGTQKYKGRHRCAANHFREEQGLVFSSIGIGTYLGEPDDRTDAAVSNAIVSAVQQGINVIDTAINYRYMHGERSVKLALSRLISELDISREELIICSKGGFIPHPDRIGWFDREYINNSKFTISESDIVAGCHCLHPEYLQDQLDRSLENLGLDTIDIYYIHNPETQLSEVSPEKFYDRLYQAFTVMEAAVKSGKIKAYGLASWNAFRLGPTKINHIDLAHAKTLAGQAAGGSEDNFKFVQLPLNPTMPEALVKATQSIDNVLVPAIEAARRLDIAPIASAAIGQARNLGKIPPAMVSALNESNFSEAMKALQFTRSSPGLLTALVGMKSTNHVAENLSLTAIEPLSEESWRAFLSKAG